MKKYRLLIVKFISVLVAFILAMGTLASCTKKPSKEIIEEIPDEKIAVNSNDWDISSGEWKFAQFEIIQTTAATSTKLIYKTPENQEWLDVSVDVKIGAGGTSGGIEFRTANTISPIDRTVFMLDKDADKAIITLTTAERNINSNQNISIADNAWYNINIKLNGASAKYYINGKLISERSDLKVKENREYIALTSNGADVSFRNFKYNTTIPENLDWQQLLASSDLHKSGYDRYNAIKFQYPYIGMGRTSLMVGANGFLNMKAPKPLSTANNYRNDPMLIYDYWWDDSIKVDPFTFGGGYMSNNVYFPGIIENDNKTAYSQTVDVESGNLISDLILNVDGELVKTKREIFVTESGVVVMKVLSETNKDFVFNVEPRSGLFSGKQYNAIPNGFVLSVNLRTDTVNKAYLAVKAPSTATVDINSGKITVPASSEPMYFYLSPSSDLNESGVAAANATQRLNQASTNGFDKEFKSINEWYKDFYSRSQISIPDQSVAKWYVRSLFYHAVSMAGTRVPPGCYANNVEGFFGGPCFEFDLMMSQHAMLYVNQPDLAQTSMNWIDRIKANARDLAENGYEDKTGHKLDPLVPNGYLFGWITGYDGTPTHGAEVGHEQGWVSLFSGANVANAYIAQEEYTDGDMNSAKDILLGQARVLLSFFKFKPEADIWVHKGVWAGGDNYSEGAFSESMAAVYSIETAMEMLEKFPEIFTQTEKDEIAIWANMLPKLPPYGDKITTAYDPEKGAYILLHTTSGIKEMVVGQNGIVGGPTNMPYLWYKTLPLDHFSTKPTMLAIAESGQFDYNFNTGWSSTVMARAGQSDFAADFTRFMLRPTSLYDDFYFCENKNDSEDYERSPALGGHGAFIMGVSSQLFDGDSMEEIKVFPAINETYQNQGSSFSRFLAKGNIEVSGTYTNEKTTVSLKNNSSKQAVRDIYIRISEGSGAGIYQGEEYQLIDGCFIKVKVTIPSGGTVNMDAKGKLKDVEVESFSAEFPKANARGIRTNNVAFGWTRSNNVANYLLVVSKNANLSKPIFTSNVGTSTFYYPLNSNKQINLEEGTKYFWTVYGMNGENSKIMTDGILSFTTLSSSLKVFNQEFDAKGNVDKDDDGNIVIKIAGGSNDTTNTALRSNDSKNFTIDTVLTYKPTKDHQQAGVLLYVNDSEYVKFTRAFTNGSKVFEFKSSSGAMLKTLADNNSQQTVYFRLSFDMQNITAKYSVDGETFITVGTFKNPIANKTVKIGVFGSVWSNINGGEAIFSKFDVRNDV